MPTPKSCDICHGRLWYWFESVGGYILKDCPNCLSRDKADLLKVSESITNALNKGALL